MDQRLVHVPWLAVRVGLSSSIVGPLRRAGTISAIALSARGITIIAKILERKNRPTEQELEE